MGAARKLDLDLVHDPAGAAALLDPMRQRLVGSLTDSPDSAAGLARRLDLPRQKVNYHLRELEKAGLVELVEERKKGNCTERLVQATAHHYLVDPSVLGSLAAEPGNVRDKFSWAYMVAVAARAIRELAVLRKRADSVGKPLQTMTLEAEVRFKSQQALHAFSEELAGEVARLVAKYHDEQALGGRAFRFMLAAHPKITKTEAQARAEAAQARATRPDSESEDSSQQERNDG